MRNRRFIVRTVMSAVSFFRESVLSEEYSAKKGLLQSIDPKFSLLSVLMLILSALFARRIEFIAGLYILVLILAAASSINLWFFLRRTWFFIPLFSLLIAIPAVFSTFTPGEPLWTLKIFRFNVIVTRQGFLGAVIFFMRVLVSVSLTGLLVLVTGHQALLKALSMFGIPGIFVMILGMCYRYVFLFTAIIRDTYTTVMSRTGGLVSTGSGQRIAAFSMAGLWQRSYSLQEQVYRAMLSRGYTGKAKSLEEPRGGIADIICLSASILLFFAITWKTYFSN